MYFSGLGFFIKIHNSCIYVYGILEFLNLNGLKFHLNFDPVNFFTDNIQLQK